MPMIYSYMIEFNQTPTDIDEPISTGYLNALCLIVVQTNPVQLEFNQTPTDIDEPISTGYRAALCLIGVRTNHVQLRI